MESSKPQFDYEALLEACGIQDVNIKKAIEGKSTSDAKFHEELINFKKLSTERDDKNEKLYNIKLTQKKNLHKLNKILNKTSTLNRELKLIQDETSQLQIELQKQSDDFVKNMVKMDEQLKELYTRFDGETLTNLIKEVDDELLYYHDTELQLQKTYENLKNFHPDLTQYERITILKIISDEFPKEKNSEEIERKIADKRKNIQFLEAEYNKKMESLEKFI